MVLKRLQEHMDKIGITDEELAGKAMLSSRTIVNMRKCKGCTRNNGIRVARTLGIRLEVLL